MEQDAKYDPHDLVAEWVETLCGKGTRNVMRLAKMPLTCELAKATGLSLQQGQMALEFLRFEVALVEGATRLWDTLYPPEVARLAYTWNLDLNQTGINQDQRRQEVTRILGLKQGWEWYRKGPEYQFLLPLAKQIVAM
jgi:hypothetical protein